MVDASQPTTKALLLQAPPLSKTARGPDKVSALSFFTSHHVIANAPKISTEGVPTADMSSDPETPNSPEQDCPFFKLPTELRLEIFRFAIQHALDLVNPPPNTDYRYSATQTTRGALALLYTCRTLRAESIDAMEPLANASRSSLQSEIHHFESSTEAAIMTMTADHARFIAYITTLDYELNHLQSRMTEIDEVCSVLAFAREADAKIKAGGGTDRLQLRSQRKHSNRDGQWVMWSGA